MKISILQIDIEWGSAQENIRRAEALMAQAPGSDLYVLPEMWSTGFATDPHDIVESETDNVALEWMRQTARERHCAISGTLAVKTGDVYKNRHYFIDGRNGIESYYDKHHLFRYGP